MKNLNTHDLYSFLAPPGYGVYTVTTASDKKEFLSRLLFGCVDYEEVHKSFQKYLESFANLDTSKKVALLGVCSDNGGGILRGANWGPLFIREQIYQTPDAKAIFDLGDIRVIPHLLHDKYLNKKTIHNCQKALYGQENDKPVSPLSITRACLKNLYAIKPDLKILSLGGDHSVSYPLVKTYFEQKAKLGIKAALIHFDAHTDLLSERLGIDICFGSWLTHVLPSLDEPANAIQIGLRASNKPKEYWEEKFGIQQFWAKDVKEQGIRKILDKIISYLTDKNITEIYISFDIDGLDATYAPSTGTPEPNGLTLKDAKEAIHRLQNSFKLTGADIVEVAPMISGKNAQKRTLLSAKEISQSLINGLSTN